MKTEQEETYRKLNLELCVKHANLKGFRECDKNS